MNKAILLPILLALTLNACASSRDPGAPTEKPASSESDVEAFARTVDELRGEMRIPGLSVAVARDGRILLSRGFGWSDVERQVAASPETLYPIGSITKTFTSTLMLQLVEQGRLDLEAPVSRHVTWQVPADVHVRHVLSHTSEGEPGERFIYSERFNWLDNVVESATKGSFPLLLKEGVLQPAGLTNTFGGTGDGAADAAAHPGLATPYVWEDGRQVRSEFPPMGLHSSSGLHSTVLDLVAYSAALDDGRLLRAETRERAFSPTVSTQGGALPYGLGWFTQQVAGERVVWHGAWWPRAFSGMLLKVPEKRLTLAVLANSDALSAPQLGASNALLFPIANAFLRSFAFKSEEDPLLRGADLLGRAAVDRWRGDAEASDALARQALDCCQAAVQAISDDDLLRLLGESADPRVRATGQDAGRRLLAAFPNNADVMFNLGISYGLVRREFRIQGPQAGDAAALFERILSLNTPIPDWMEGWSAYLVAEHLAAQDPARARKLAERAVATKVDSDGLQGRVAGLLGRLP
ncbi:MAG TPA: serine hydrolase domain-containing protein [Thermoanaerobaculia bacterium]|nr:serine hydrolase domain-containing protein [Thermoanaerobaculia bacterium]